MASILLELAEGHEHAADGFAGAQMPEGEGEGGRTMNSLCVLCEVASVPQLNLWWGRLLFSERPGQLPNVGILELVWMRRTRGAAMRDSTRIARRLGFAPVQKAEEVHNEGQ